jgi:hypothetical protein
MGTKSIGWYILLFGVILGISDYLRITDYLFGKSIEPFNFSSWILTPIFWATIALIVVGFLMVKFGSRKSPMPIYQR